MRSSLLIFILLVISITAQATRSTDSLITILRSKESKEQQQLQIARLCYDRFLRSTAYDQLAPSMVNTLDEYGLSGKKELNNLIQMLIYRRDADLLKAEKLLTQSIALAKQHKEDYFLYLFYLNQAYVQTDLGNALNGVYNYRASRKVAEEIGNTELFVTTDIGISDIYTDIGLYPQAIMYLDQAQEAFGKSKTSRTSSKMLIYLNKAEIYFKIAELDSLRLYTQLANRIKETSTYTERSIKRLNYFVLILETKYDSAIPLIKELVNTGDLYYKKVDRWHLAECYYLKGEIDSAYATAKLLLEDGSLTPSPIKLDALKLLAKIAAEKNSMTQANHYLVLALAESEDYSIRLTKIGDLASELRLDRMESNYHAKNLIYEKERTIMIVTIIGAVLGVIAILVSYRNIKQKNRFQKLLHQARSKELAFINSHQVRKPLANILGLCNLAENKGLSTEEMQEYFKQVHKQAQEMDYKLKDVEKKLNSHSEIVDNII